MKKLLAALLLACISLDALPQVPQVYPSMMRPTWGFARKSPCTVAGQALGDVCGSNPPTWHITPDQCGHVFSTSQVRNSDGSLSTKGIKYTLPTVAELLAAGFGPVPGNSGAAGFTNREAQCDIHFVMGAPGPTNYLRVGLSGLLLVDKITAFAQTGYDIANGELVYPYSVPNVVSFFWNGTSWLTREATPAFAELMGMGQLNSHGQGRLFQVTADPSWWTAGSRIGALAFCPNNGRGFVANSNGGFQLTLLPIQCVFRENQLGASTTDLIVVRNITGGSVTAIAAGAAYGGGTAPNGVAYGAGNYVVLTVGTTLAFASGNTIEVHNVQSNGGTVIEGKWIGKLIDATHIELHQSIDDGVGGGISNVGPPSSFVAADTILQAVSGQAFNYTALSSANIAGGRESNPVTATEREATGHDYTVIGVARYLTGTGYQDTATNRLVASYFSPIDKKCQTVFSTDRTVTSLTFVEVNSEIRCNFVFINGVSQTLVNLGDTGRRVRYSATVGVGNGTASDGCEFAVAFDGTTAEAEVAGFVNPAGVTGGRQTVTVTGAKVGLTENNHYITLLARAVTGGTCTIYAASTTLTAMVWQ